MPILKASQLDGVTESTMPISIPIATSQDPSHRDAVDACGEVLRTGSAKNDIHILRGTQQIAFDDSGRLPEPGIVPQPGASPTLQVVVFIKRLDPTVASVGAVYCGAATRRLARCRLLADPRLL